MRAGMWSVLLMAIATLGPVKAAKQTADNYTDFEGRFEGTGGMDLAFVEPPPGESFTLPLVGKMTAVVKVTGKGAKAVFRLTGTFDVAPNADGITADQPIPVALGFSLSKGRIKITEMALAGQSLLTASISGKVKARESIVTVEGAQQIQLVPLPGLNLAGTAQASFKGKVKIADQKTTDTFTVTIPDLGQGVSLTARCYFDGKKKK